MPCLEIGGCKTTKLFCSFKGLLLFFQIESCSFKALPLFQWANPLGQRTFSGPRRPPEARGWGGSVLLSLACSAGRGPEGGAEGGAPTASLTRSHSRDTWLTRHGEPGKTGTAPADSDSVKNQTNCPKSGWADITLNHQDSSACSRLFFQE